MLRLPRAIFDDLTALAYETYPLECCGLIAGRADLSMVQRFYRCRNAAGSAKVYTVDAFDYLHAERDAERAGWEIIGVLHSHTHTEPYPSPTDIAQAPDPDWRYLIISLKRESPELRCYRIVGEDVTEEALTLIES